jgi:hypothetical protein
VIIDCKSQIFKEKTVPKCAAYSKNNKHLTEAISEEIITTTAYWNVILFTWTASAFVDN